MHEGPIVMPHLVLPPPMLPLALEAPSTPTKVLVERECPGAPRCVRSKPKHRGVQWALDGFDDEQPQRGFDSAETLEMLPEPSLDEDALLETIDARLEVVLREAAQFKDAAKLWRECASVALLDPTPDWQARAWLDMHAQLVERVGPVEPCVEEVLRALFERGMELDTSES